MSIEQGQKSRQDGDINEERATRYIYTDSGSESDAVSVEASLGVDYYDEHPEDDTLLVKQIRTQALDPDGGGRFHWETQVDYSNMIINPLGMPAKIEWDFSESSETYFFDTQIDGTHPNGHPVVNSAGQEFDGLPSRESGSITATITKNVAADFDVSLFLSFRETINESGFTVDGVSIDTDQAKCSGANVSPPQKSNGVWYRVVKLVLKFRETWLDEIADKGYYETNGAGGLKKIMRVGISGNLLEWVAKPWPLNGSGAAQANATDTPAKLSFKPYVESDFSSLSSLFT